MFFSTPKHIILVITVLLMNSSSYQPIIANKPHSVDTLENINNLLNDTSFSDKSIDSIEKEEGQNLFSKRPTFFFPNNDFDKPAILIIVLSMVIIYSASSIFILFIFIIINRNRREKRQIKIAKLKEKFQMNLVNYLGTSNPKESMDELINIANTRFTRKILTNEMIDVSINLQRKEALRLRSLYFKLGLHYDSLLKLKSMHWHTRIKGFKECAFMNIQESIPKIKKWLHSRNAIVRSEAQLALVRLNTSDPYSFLDHLKRPFSVWEQSIVYQEIMYYNLATPRFERWLDSENESIRRFASKMIHIFEQKRSWEKLVALLDDKNESVRASAIYSLGNLNVKNSQKQLKIHYKDESIENRLLILNALGKFRDINNMVFFLHTIEEEEDHVWLQVEAAKSIRELGEDGKIKLEELLQSNEYRNYQIIIKHVLNERL